MKHYHSTFATEAIQAAQGPFFDSCTPNVTCRLRSIDKKEFQRHPLRLGNDLSATPMIRLAVRCTFRGVPARTNDFQ